MIERNVVFKDFRNKLRVALVFPNLYTVGMANLGFQILYDLLNCLEDVYAERFFLDFEKSLETKSRLKDFDIIAFTWQFELDAMNILEILHRSGIPLRREERSKLVVVGGPCAANPYPLKNFIDVFFIGEAEVNLIPFIELFSKAKEVEVFGDIPGLYVSELNNPVKRVCLENLDEYHPIAQIMSPEAAFDETFLLEVSRGCGRGCRFCLGGFTSRPPRERSLERLKEIIDDGIEANDPKKISVLGASASDYSHIDKLCEYLAGKGLELSIPSLRADSLSPTVVKALVRTGQHSLTLAPETSQRLRKAINKDMSNGEIMDAVKMAFQGGIKNLKLYYMIGLPWEEDKDVIEITDIVKEIKTMGRVKLSVNPFIPKPHTPLQWTGLVDFPTYRRRLRILKKELRIEVEEEDYKSAFLQATIARGDEDLSRIMEKAFYYGKGLGALRRAFKEEGKDLYHYVKGRNFYEPLPWDNIDTGVRTDFLMEEYEKSYRGEVSGVCNERCRACGVC